MSLNSPAEQLADLYNTYGLTDEDCDKKVSDRHLEKISRSLCKEWKRLYPYLGMTRIEVDDIVCKQDEESVKRHAFFLKWKEKGSKATYKALLGALLEINSREDSEGICKLLLEQPSTLSASTTESNSVVSVAAGII